MKRVRMHVCFHCGLLETSPTKCRRCASKLVERRVPIPLPTAPGWWFPLVIWVFGGCLLTGGALLSTLMGMASGSSGSLGMALIVSLVGLGFIAYGLRFGFERTYRFDSKVNPHLSLYVYELGGQLLRVHLHKRQRLALRAPLSKLIARPPRFISLSRVQSVVWRLNKPDVLNAWGQYLGPWKSKPLNATRFNLFLGLLRLVGHGKAEVWRQSVSSLKWYSHLNKPTAHRLHSNLCVVKTSYPPESGFEKVWWDCLPGNLEAGVMLFDASDLISEHFDDVKGIATMNKREAFELGEQLTNAYCEDEDHMLRDIERELNRCRWLDAAR